MEAIELLVVEGSSGVGVDVIVVVPFAVAASFVNNYISYELRESAPLAH